jgi:hypothetical protein
VDCSYCKKPVTLAFDMTEAKPNGGEVKRRACFPCLEDIGRREMAKANERRTTSFVVRECRPGVQAIVCPKCGVVRELPVWMDAKAWNDAVQEFEQKHLHA